MNYDLVSRISYKSTNEKTKNQTVDTNLKQKEFVFDISPRIGIGYGRIETVRDARQAVYIANALAKKNVLTRNLSDDELFKLSQIISSVKNKRFLDSRLRLIEEITTVDSFFENNDLLADNGATYFTTLYDMWQYGDLFLRQSGYEIAFSVYTYNRYVNEKYIPHSPTNHDMIYNLFQQSMNLNFSYEKPYRLNWQHSLSANVTGSIHSTSVQNKPAANNNKNNTKSNSFLAIGHYSFGYYPNTRTNIRLTTAQQLSKNIYDDDRQIMSFSSALSANLYYYFSPNLRLTGDYTIHYSPSRLKGDEVYYSNINYFSSSLYIKLTYFIF